MLWTIGQKRKRVKNNYKPSGNLSEGFFFHNKIIKEKNGGK